MTKTVFGGFPLSGQEYEDEYRRKVEAGELVIIPQAETEAVRNGEVKLQTRVIEVPDFTREVNAGAAWLDANVPGWWKEVDVSTLNLADENACMLGQTWPLYAKAQGLLEEQQRLLDQRLMWHGGDRTNFRRFLLAKFDTSNEDNQVRAMGFQLPRSAYSWINVHAHRIEQGQEPKPDNAGNSIPRYLDTVLWEHLTRTWAAMIKARQEQAMERRAALRERATGMSVEDIIDLLEQQDPQ